MTRVLVAAALASLCATPMQAQETSGSCAAAVATRGVPEFIDCAREATRKYADRSLAIRDGYRRIGRDFPAIGEHWINVGLVAMVSSIPNIPKS
jgi:hypothetical protein